MPTLTSLAASVGCNTQRLQHPLTEGPIPKGRWSFKRGLGNPKPKTLSLGFRGVLEVMCTGFYAGLNGGRDSLN